MSTNKIWVEWIPIEEELPYNNEVVLVSTLAGIVYRGYLFNSTWYVEYGRGFEPSFTVNAWMRLPEAYREDFSFDKRKI